jgi:hypothetical protein
MSLMKAHREVRVMGKATGSFQLSSWDEESYDEGESGKMSLATVGQDFSGDITGDGSVRWLMVYGAEGTARFVGLQKIAGTLADRHGTFVLETAGDFDGKMARWKATVVPGTGTGELVGLSGSGEFGAVHGPEATYEIEYELS